MSVAVELQDGRGFAHGFSNGVLTLDLERAFAPGAPIRFHVSLASGALTLQGKTIGSKRQEDGRFQVRVRLINLRREDRIALEALDA